MALHMIVVKLCVRACECDIRLCAYEVCLCLGWTVVGQTLMSASGSQAAHYRRMTYRPEDRGRYGGEGTRRQRGGGERQKGEETLLSNVVVVV